MMHRRHHRDGGAAPAGVHGPGVRGLLTRGLVAATCLLAVNAVPAAGQEWRTVNASRQAAGESGVETRINYAAGTLNLRPGSRGQLYAMELRYRDDQFRPLQEYRDGELELGLESRGRNINLGGSDRGNELDLLLGTGVPMALDVSFGAGRGMLDLGGVRLTRLDLATGASETTLDVSSPNPEGMEEAALEVGAAEFTGLRLGNLNARRISLDAGVGDVTLDFSGGEVVETDVEVSMGLGALELRFPTGVGVRIEKDSFLTSMETPEMVKRDGVWYSRNWDDATRRIRLEVDAAFGSVEVVWLR